MIAMQAKMAASLTKLGAAKYVGLRYTARLYKLGGAEWAGETSQRVSARHGLGVAKAIQPGIERALFS